jgi:hypothetical protein
LLTVAETRLGRVVASLFDQAEAGNVQACELVLRYALGRAAPAVDVDRVTSGLDEVRLMLQRPFGMELVLYAMEAFPPAVALEFLKAAHSAKADPTASMGTTGGDDDRDDDESGWVKERFSLLAALKAVLLRHRAARG